MAVDTETWRIKLSDIDLGPEEEEAVLRVLRSKWLSMGPVTAEFEGHFAEAVGCRHAVAVSSGTSALHLALLSTGVGPGDEVIVPALTFVATVNAVLYCGAEPVFADIIGPASFLIDPEDVGRKLGSRTKAVLPMHYGGYPCDMDALRTIARERRLRIVEDAAHAPGASWGGEPVGSIGDASCFSFFSNKNLVTGEGGMVTTNDDAVADFIRINRSHGMTAVSYDKARGHAFSYDVVSSGFNYRLTEIESALGIVQLRKLQHNNAIRRRLVKTYHARLRRIDGLTLPFEGHEDKSACHLYPVVLPERSDRTQVQRALKKQRIQTSIHYPPVHQFSGFRGRFAANVPNLDAVSDRIVTLPLHPLLSEEDVEVVCQALREAL